MNIFRNKKYKRQLSKVNKKANIKRYIEFIIGCLIVAIAFNLFFSPNNLVPGGVGGIAIILNSLFGINNSLVILVLDIILLIVSYFLLDNEQTKSSILGSFLFPLFVSLTGNINKYINIDTSQILLSAVFGGVLNGFGAGMIFKAGFTTGGTDIINQILSKYFKMSIGKSMIFSDGIIVLLSSFIFGPTKLMYAIIIIYLISFMSDRVILGISDSKAFYIITDEDEKVKQYIIEYLGHGVTVFNAKGGFAKEKQTVLMCVLPTKDYYRLKEGLHEIDKNAFFVVTDAYEVFGGE